MKNDLKLTKNQIDVFHSRAQDILSKYIDADPSDRRCRSSATESVRREIARRATDNLAFVVKRGSGSSDFLKQVLIVLADYRDMSLEFAAVQSLRSEGKRVEIATALVEAASDSASGYE